MATVTTPTTAKSLSLHSSSFHSRSFVNSGSSSIRFRSSRLGFDGGAKRGVLVDEKPIKWRSPKTAERRGRGLVVRSTAEGIERGMVMGREANKLISDVVPERMKVVALLACVMCLCNADRVVMSVAIVPLADHYGWSSSFLGIVQVCSSSTILISLFFFFDNYYINFTCSIFLQHFGWKMARYLICYYVYVDVANA